jgi:DNA gyrase subunit B
VDEAREGHGKEIIVTVWRDRTIQVEDFGRGVPVGWNEREKRWNWELVFCELYAGGKYSNNSSSSVYQFSLGMNGLGATATQYTSEFMTVKSYNGKQLSEIDFKKGKPTKEKLRVRDLERSDKKKTGTVIKWRPDSAVFTDVNIPITFFEEMLYRQSVVNAGIRFVLNAENEDRKTFSTKEYYYENGIVDHMEDITKGSSLTPPVVWHMPEQVGSDREDLQPYKLKADIAFCVTTTNPTTEYYHNSSYLSHGGAPDRAVKSAFAFALDKYLQKAGKYGKNESKIGFADIQENLIVIISSASTKSSYEGQTKKAVDNPFIFRALDRFLKDQLEIYLTENPTAAEIFAKQVLDSKHSREEAEKTRLDVKKALGSTVMDASNRVEKFVSCRSKDATLRELYIVEGDSALTSCVLGRNAEYQAIIPVRGKTLNCMKADYSKIFASQIITDLLRVIGCGVEITGKTKLKSEFATFDLSALKWAKIIICTDADEDGFQIRTLLLTLFYRLLPTLIREGRVFIAESPLFEITTKTDTYFAYNEQEKSAILQQLGDTKYTLQRSKGLGENEPEMMWKTTMNPATRRLISVCPADEERTLYMFDTLLGEDREERKRFIAENGWKYIKDADI